MAFTDDTNRLLPEWYTVSQQMQELKARELELRQQIFKDTFPDPKEGINTFNIPGSLWVIKGEYKINRTVDEAAFEAQREMFRANGITAPEDLIKRKPELVKSAYNKLSPELQQLFDRCLTLKPGTPGLTVDLPKRRT